MSKVVIVAFQVDRDNLAEAEQIVEDRLNPLPVLWQNDSTDVERGTLDPIRTYAVVRLDQILEDAR